MSCWPSRSSKPASRLCRSCCSAREAQLPFDNLRRRSDAGRSIARCIGSSTAPRDGCSLRPKRPGETPCRSGSRRQRQHRDRGGRPGARRRLHAAADRDAACDQRRALQQSQFRFPAGHRAGGLRRAAGLCRRGASAGLRRHAYARTKPGKINYGSAGSGTPPNIAAELFKMMTG